MAQNVSTTVGRLLPGKVGKSRRSCWELPANLRETYDRDISSHIRGSFRNQETTQFRDIAWSPFMVGLVASIAEPTVVIFRGQDRKARRDACDLVRDIREIAANGFRVKHNKTSPNTEGLVVVLALRDDDFDYQRRFQGLPVLHKAWAPICGQSLWINLKVDEGRESLQKATGGGIIRSNDKYYYLTVAHIIDNSILAGLQTRDSDSENSDSEDSDDDSVHSEVDAELTSRGSITPELMKSNQDSSSGESTQQVLSSSLTRSEEISTDIIDRGSTSMSSSSKQSDLFHLGKTAFSSVDGGFPSLDYMLIEISQPTLQKSNRIPLRDSEDGKFLYPERIVNGLFFEDASIIIVTGSGGFKRGFISGTATHVVQDNNHIQELWSIRIAGTFEKGDCGSWVVDATTGDLYGHLVAGELESGFGYLIPAYLIFDDIWANDNPNFTLSSRPPPYEATVSKADVVARAYKWNEFWPPGTRVVPLSMADFEGGFQIQSSRTVSYKRLETPGSIRLLSLKAASDYSVDIECTLDAKLITSESFEAVSWIWSVTASTEPLRISNSGKVETIFVSAELIMLLKSLRHRSDERTLWIDYLCINQADYEEKTSQVDLMPEIFKSASNVCVWLGAADEDSDRAMRFVPQMLTLFMDDNDAKFDAKNWRSLVALMNRPWFWRRWVVQELALAREAIIYCGTQSLRFRDLQIAIDLFSEIENATNRLSDILDTQAKPKEDMFDPLIDVHQFPAVKLIEILSRSIRRTGDGSIVRMTSLVDLVVSFAMSHEVSTPSDTIYSLLGLAADGKDFSAAHTIDYSKQPVEVFIDFIQHSMQHLDPARALDVMLMPWAPLQKDSREDLRYPSWIRDVSHFTFGKQQSPSGQGSYLRRINAEPLVGGPRHVFYSAGTRHAASASFVDGRHRKSVLAAGILVDEIEELEEPAYSGYLPIEWLKTGAGARGSRMFQRSFGAPLLVIEALTVGIHLLTMKVLVQKSLDAGHNSLLC